MTPSWLPVERRAALDAALARLTETLAHDAPLFAQLDLFKEHVEEPSLAEWCCWFAETKQERAGWSAIQLLLGVNQILRHDEPLRRLQIVWAAWLEQTEPDHRMLPPWLHFETMRWRAVHNTAPALPAYRRDTQIESEVREFRGQSVRTFKRKVLSLFPGVVAWEQEFVRPIPLSISNQDELNHWFLMARKDVEAKGFGKYSRSHGSELTATQIQPHDPVYFNERLYANQLVPGEGGKPIAPKK